MASDSVVGAVVAYCRAQTVGGLPVLAYRDSAPAEENGTPVVPPYVVVRDEGGRGTRDFEGNVIGPSSLTLTVTAKLAADARAILDQLLFAAQPPASRAGIEAAGALDPYLSGYEAGSCVWADDLPRESRATVRRGPDLQHTVTQRLTVHAERS